MRSLTFGLCAVVLVLWVRGAAARTTAEIEGFLDPLVLAQLESRKIAGAVVVVVNNGVVVLSKGYGHADVAAARPMGPDALVRIASITKTLTALAVMQLVETGRLDLDRDVNAYLDFAVPSVPGHPPVTLRRVLSHRSGFENRTAGIGAWAGDRMPLGPFLARNMPPRLHHDDDVVAYSNYNASLAAYIVERASGRSFEQYLQDHIFDSLQMTSTTAVQPLPDWLLARASNGYVLSDLPPTRTSMATATIYEVGSTGVTTSGSDMARLMRALLADQPEVVSRAALDTMMTTQTPTPRGVVGLGLFSPLGAGGNAFIGHDGSTGGFHSTLALLPQERFGVFASYNSAGLPQALRPQEELLQRISERYFADVRLPSNGGRSVDVAGVYQLAAGADSNFFTLRRLFSQVAVRLEGGTLTIRPAVLPFGAPLDESEPGLFRWSGRDVSFAKSGRSAVMQIGSPVGLLLRVPWWASASLVVPVIAASGLIAGLAVLWWPVAAVRRRQVKMDPTTRRLKLATRLALLSSLLAISGSLWLVFWGWPLAAMSSPIVAPLALAIYASAWGGVLLTAPAVWHAVRCTRRRIGGVWGSLRAYLLAVVAMTLAAFCLYWRIAGITLAF